VKYVASVLTYLRAACFVTPYYRCCRVMLIAVLDAVFIVLWFCNFLIFHFTFGNSSCFTWTKTVAYTTTTTTTVLWPFFRNRPCEPVPEENFWTLWCKGRLTEADKLTIRLGATLSGLTSAHLHHPPIFFYGPDSLPAAQPTVSQHRRQLAQWSTRIK